MNSRYKYNTSTYQWEDMYPPQAQAALPPVTAKCRYCHDTGKLTLLTSVSNCTECRLPPTQPVLLETKPAPQPLHYFYYGQVAKATLKPTP